MGRQPAKQGSFLERYCQYGAANVRYLQYNREQRRVYKRGLLPVDPVTPDVRQVCSKRGFDGQVNKQSTGAVRWLAFTYALCYLLCTKAHKIK